MWATEGKERTKATNDRKEKSEINETENLAIILFVWASAAAAYTGLAAGGVELIGARVVVQELPDPVRVGLQRRSPEPFV